MDQKLQISSQKLNYEKEIAAITKKFTTLLRENENIQFKNQHELKFENTDLIQKNIEYDNKAKILINENEILSNELKLFKCKNIEVETSISDLNNQLYEDKKIKEQLIIDNSILKKNNIE